MTFAFLGFTLQKRRGFGGITNGKGGCQYRQWHGVPVWNRTHWIPPHLQKCHRKAYWIHFFLSSEVSTDENVNIISNIRSKNSQRMVVTHAEYFTRNDCTRVMIAHESIYLVYF